QTVAAGNVAMSPDIARSMIAEFPDEPVEETNRPAAPESPLTKRELEILQLVADRQSTAEIGRGLFIRGKTVKNHCASISAKRDARDRTQAVLSGVRLGIVQLQ